MAISALHSHSQSSILNAQFASFVKIFYQRIIFSDSEILTLHADGFGNPSERVNDNGNEVPTAVVSASLQWAKGDADDADTDEQGSTGGASGWGDPGDITE